MNNPFKKSGTALSNKLKGALTDLSVDVFGYEKIVTKNILKQTDYISKKLEIPRERLYVRIFQKNHIIRAFLYDQQKPLHAIPIDELAYFFVNPETVALASIQNKMAFSIKQYLKELADANKIHVESTRIWIYTKGSAVNVMAFQNDEFIKDITLSSLIKYFR